jgi:hypothetical protein
MLMEALMLLPPLPGALLQLPHQGISLPELKLLMTKIMVVWIGLVRQSEWTISRHG